LRGLGKPDARTLAESQRLSAELSKVHEELERARASAEENMLLRRELSRLASQILNVARTQNVAQHPRGVNVAQVYTQPSAMAGPQPQLEPQQAWEPAQAGNGAAHEQQEEAEPVAEVDAVAAGMTRAADAEPANGPAEDDDQTESGAEEQSASFAQRFVARREARRTRKGGGMSLGARLRGLVAERPET